MNMANDDDDDEADKPINNSTNKIIFIYINIKNNFLAFAA